MLNTVDASADADRHLLNAKELAAKLRCSVRHVYRLSDAGRMPRPLKLGALVRWDPASIDHWITSGCPNCRKSRANA